MSINLDITVIGIPNFIQKYKLMTKLHELIDVMYNDVPQVNVSNDVATSVFFFKVGTV